LKINEYKQQQKNRSSAQGTDNLRHVRFMKTQAKIRGAWNENNVKGHEIWLQYHFYYSAL